MSLPHGYDAETARAMAATALGRTRPPKEFETTDEMIAAARAETAEQQRLERAEQLREARALAAGVTPELDKRVDAFVHGLTK